MFGQKMDVGSATPGGVSVSGIRRTIALALTTTGAPTLEPWNSTSPLLSLRPCS
jgi:hypothetical protein